MTKIKIGEIRCTAGGSLQHQRKTFGVARLTIQLLDGSYSTERTCPAEVADVVYSR